MEVSVIKTIIVFTLAFIIAITLLKQEDE